MILAECKEEFRKSRVKTNGEKAAFKAGEKTLKETKTEQRETLRYANVIDGKQYVCNRNYVFKFNEHLPFENMPKNLAPEVVMKETFDNIHLSEYKELALPELLDLKLEFKANRASKSKKFYSLGNDLPMVKLEYLINIMDAMNGNCKCYCHKTKSERSPLYFKSDDGKVEAVLLPVIIKK